MIYTHTDNYYESEVLYLLEYTVLRHRPPPGRFWYLLFISMHCLGCFPVSRICFVYNKVFVNHKRPIETTCHTFPIPFFILEAPFPTVIRIDNS